MHRKLYIPVVLLVLVTIGLELLNIHLAGKVASDGVAVKKLQISIAKLNEENQILQSKVLSETSFENISSKAATLGFVENHDSYISLRKSHLTYSR